VGKSETRN